MSIFRRNGCDFKSKTAPLDFSLEEPESIQTFTNDWSQRLRQTLASTVKTWLESEDGNRHSLIVLASACPSDVKSEATWNAFLAVLKSSAPKLADLLPQLDDLALTVALTPDLRDATRRNLRILLENNSREARKRQRDRFEHAVHQVELNVTLPRAAHQIASPGSRPALLPISAFSFISGHWGQLRSSRTGAE